MIGMFAKSDGQWPPYFEEVKVTILKEIRIDRYESLTVGTVIRAQRVPNDSVQLLFDGMICKSNAVEGVDFNYVTKG